MQLFVKDKGGFDMKSVQMINDNYDIIHNPKVKELYPMLYKEVVEHDKNVLSSWYELSDEAYKEYKLYCDNKEICYVR